MSALLLEVRKQRHSRLPILILGLLAFEMFWMVGMTVVSAGHATGIRRLLAASLYDFLNFMTLLAGPTVGLVASRIAGVDQVERMGQVFRAFGASVISQFITKLCVVSAIASAMYGGLFLVAVFVGARSGLTPSPAYYNAFWAGLLVTLSSSVAISSVQLFLAMRFENAAAGVIIGLVGALVSSFLPFLNLQALGWLLPWGLNSAANPFRVVTPSISKGHDFVLNSHPWPTAGAAALCALGWVLATSILISRQETSS